MKKIKLLIVGDMPNLQHIMLTMKLTITLMLFACLHVSANSFSQDRITLKLQSVELKTVLTQIEEKSSFRFLYNNDEISSEKRVSVNAVNSLVTEVLDDVVGSSGLAYKVLENNLVVITKKLTPLQAIVVNGHVTNDKGETLPGVSVKVKGSVSGTTTDEKGNYSISVPEGSTLIFSSVGYTTKEEVVNGRAEINVVLQTITTALNEVVVVGYGTQRKIDVTGATASVKGAELVKQPVLTATQAIQGKVAGVQIISSGQPGSQPSVRIRGTGSILGGAEPLYVVDGVITTDITNLSTADIVSFDILKDASSTAIYGARGANGVIMITTKQGTSGRMQITYNGNVGLQTASHLVKMADTKEYANYISAASYGLTTLPTTNISTNWYGEILRNAIEQNHNISISGASDKVKYLFNAGYSDVEGIMINNEYKRFTLRSNDEFKLADNLRLGVTASYSNGNNLIPNISTAYNDAYRSAPNVPGRVNGKYGNTSLYQNVGNPILDLNDENGRNVDNRLEGNAFLEYKPVKWLTLRSGVGADWDNTVNTVYNYAFAADTSTFIKAGGNQSNTVSSLGVNAANSLHWLWDNTATFNKKYNKQNITVLVGTTAEQTSSGYIYASAKGVPPATNLWYINNGNLATGTSVNGLGTKVRRNSYLARANYGYDSKYLLTATFRADGSSAFPLSNRWGYFPSIGAGWVISNENFMQKQQIFNLLKLRGSWGQAGNDVTGAGSGGYTSTLLTNLPYYFGGAAVSGSVPSQIVDQNLKWETTTESDIAVEFGLLNSRLSGEFSYYSKTTRNSLIDVLVPATLGSYNPSGNAGYVLTNAASVQNKGVELMLSWHDKMTNGLYYSISPNITFNKNTIVGLNGGQAFIDGQVGANQPYVTKTDVGHPIGSFYVQKMVGVYQTGLNAGNLEYQLGANGKADSVYAGSYQPKAYYGLNIGLSYKKFDVSIGGYGTIGGVIYNGKKAFRLTGQDNLEASVANSFWTNSNHSNKEPSANFFSNPGVIPASTYFVESASFFRINNLNIGYTIPASALKKTNIITSLRIYTSIQNLITITKYSGFSPEIQALVSPTANNSGVPTTSSATGAGVDLNAYPTVRTYSLGVNLGF